MSRTPGAQPFGQTSQTLGANDPRNRRNAQAQLAPNLHYEKPLRINQNQRVSIETGAYLTLDGNGKLTVDVASLRAALGL